MGAGFLTTKTGLITWVCICYIHIRFRKAYVAQGLSLDKLPYRAPFFPYGQYLAIAMGFLVLIGEGCTVVMSSDTVDWIHIIAVYVGAPFYLVLYLAYKFIRGTKVVPLLECDFTTGTVDYDALDDGETDEDFGSLDKRGRVMKKFKKVVHFLA